ncbi:MAG: MFS transporter [Polyangiaceae bacterium]
MGSRGSSGVLVILLVGYASFYLCRANVDAALPLLHDAYDYDKTKLGLLSSIATAVYAIGKITNGMLGDRIGGRRLMLLAMVGSIAATLAFGFSVGFFFFVLFAAVNRFFQSGGWSGLVHVVSRWFPPGKHGAVMGALSTSYEIGNVVSLLLCGALVKMKLPWRALFIVNPALFACVALLIYFTLRGEPTSTIDPRPPTIDPRPSTADPRPSTTDKLPLREAIPFLIKNPSFWFALVLSVLLTFVRHGFLTWTPTFLTEVARASGEGEGAVSASIAKSAIFPATGVVAALIVGRISDFFGPGKRTTVLAASLFFHVIAVLWLAHGHLHGTTSAMLAIGACGIFLLGPYSLMAGAIALDVAGTRAAATAAGFIDGAGYLGASLVGIVLGGVAQKYGWSASFDVVAFAGFSAMLVGIFATIHSRKLPRS